MAITPKRRIVLLLCLVIVSLIFLTTFGLKDIEIPEIDYQKLNSLNVPAPVGGLPVSEMRANFHAKLPLEVSSTSTIHGKTKFEDTLPIDGITPEGLSKIVQAQLYKLQNPKNCSVPTLLCGHRDNCGLACQIQHRIACLMISYATGMPLIHDATYVWPYARSWNQFFYPLGSSCTPGPDTRVLISTRSGTFATAMKSTDPDFPFPLDKGIVVPKDLADKVESFHSNPFFWWVGQFMKYGLRLLPVQRKMVQDAQDSIKFAHPIVGIHIRRTDKRMDDPNFFHPIQEYFAVAAEYYSNLTQQGISFVVRRVFLASDDQSLLLEAQKMYKAPEWKVIGFYHGRTLMNQWHRVFALDQMVKDLFTLVDCDFVVCTHSSNVCRALVGMLHMNHLDGLQRIKSIDHFPYSYLLLDHNIQMNIIKN